MGWDVTGGTAASQKATAVGARSRLTFSALSRVSIYLPFGAYFWRHVAAYRNDDRRS